MPAPLDPSGYADLAEVVLTVSREIRLRENDWSDAVSLTPSNVQVMRYIEAHPGTTSGEAAEGTGLQRTNLSTAIRELEQIGFITKRRDQADGRAIRLYPTAVAARNVSRLREQWAKALGAILGEAEGVTEATALLRRLADGLAGERRQASPPAGRRPS